MPYVRKPKKAVPKEKIHGALDFIREMGASAMAPERGGWGHLPGTPLKTAEQRRDFCIRHLESGEHDLEKMAKNALSKLILDAKKRRYSRGFMEPVHRWVGEKLSSGDKKNRGRGLMVYAELQRGGEIPIHPGVDLRAIIDEHIGRASNSPEEVRHSAMELAIKSGESRLRKKAIEEIPNESHKIKNSAIFLLKGEKEEYGIRTALLKDGNAHVRSMALFEFPTGMVVENEKAGTAMKQVLELFKDPVNLWSARKVFGKMLSEGVKPGEKSLKEALKGLHSSDVNEFGASAAYASIVSMKHPGVRLEEEDKKSMERGLEDFNFFNMAKRSIAEFSGLPEPSRVDSFMEFMAHHWDKWDGGERDRRMEEFSEVIRTSQENAYWILGIMGVLSGNRGKKSLRMPSENESLEEIQKHFEEWKKRKGLVNER